MDNVYYRMGKLVGPQLRKGKWLWQSLTGSEKDTIAAEHAVGRDLAAAFRREMPADPDTQACLLIEQTGTHLARFVANKLRRFEFSLVTADDANAFALPGGFVFITRPLLDLLAHDRDETAFVLAHEMSHVIHEDANQRMLGDAAITAAIRASPSAGLASQWLRSAAARMLQAAYSQDRELAADNLGVRLSAAAGFDPGAAVRMLGRLEQAHRTAEQSTLATYFSTHPPLDRRIAAVRRV